MKTKLCDHNTNMRPVRGLVAMTAYEVGCGISKSIDRVCGC
jgi:hypothetical protein